MESHSTREAAACTEVRQSPPHALRRDPRRLHFTRAAVVGLCAGFVAVAFRRALALAESGRGELLTALHAHPSWGWAIPPLFCAVVCGFVGWITARFAPESAGSGIPHLKGVLIHVRTLHWRRLLPVKFFGGVLGIGAGLSLGREGPTVQMGAAVARALSSLLRTPAADLPQLLSAGAGAGLAAAFNAPLAGLLFVVEELHRELSSRTAAGALIAAVCATVVTQWLAGDTPSFEVHGLTAMPLSALPLALIVGAAAGLSGVLFNRSLLLSSRFAFECRAIPRWLLTAVAGALVGCVAWWLPDAVGGGHSVAERVLGGTMGASLSTLAFLFVVKLLLTALSYGSGAPGGIFAPMLLLGAVLGAALAKGLSPLYAAFPGDGEVLAVLGMAAFFVGSVRAPLTGIVLISEMTGGYSLLFPICAACLTAYLAAEAVKDRPIYDALLENDLERTGMGESRAEPRPVYVGIQLSALVAYKRIAEAGFPRGALVVAVERAGHALLPAADTVLLPGDHISVLTPGAEPELALEVVRLCTGL